MNAAGRHALQAHRRILGRWLGCITERHIQYGLIENRGWLALNNGEPTRLRGPERLSLTVEQRIRVESRGSKVEVDGYSYRVLTANEQEILAFHLHAGQGPHLHIGAGAGELFEPLYKAHVPTGQVELAEVALMLVRDFGVEPLRADWEAVLNPAPA